MEWFQILINNFPIILLGLLALLFCAAEVIKAVKVLREENGRRVNNQIQARDQEISQQNAFTEMNMKMDLILTRLNSIEDRLNKTDERIKDLTISDMHDIKGWIVEQYHKFYNEQGWIDAFSAETIDRRFNDYKKEGGNSYIQELVDRLHDLPMDPPNNK